MSAIRSGVVAVWLGAVIACGGGSGGGNGPGNDPGGCTPTAVCAASWCGPHPDGCGGTLSCPATCGGADVCNAFVSGYCAACTADGFCADTPDVFKGGYTSVFGTSASDVWAVELDAAIFQWNGTGWRDRTSTALVAEGRTTSNGPERVWGTSPTSLWGVSSWGVFRWNGTAWSFVEGRFGAMYGLWGTSATDVWAVGDAGTIIHWDGTGWTKVESGTTQILLDVWATSATDAWAVGQNGVLLRWNGTSWTRPYLVSTPVDFRAIQPIGANEALVLTEDGELARWTGSDLVSWAPGQARIAWDFWAFAADDVWRVGDAGEIQHWDGASWTAYDGGTTAALYGVWGAPNGDVWVAASDNQVLRLSAAR